MTDVCFAFSEYSEPASFYTSGSVPSQPDPPMLSEPFTTSLIISWIKHPNEDSFQLQMDDESTVRKQLHANYKPLNQAPSMSSWSLKYMYIFFDRVMALLRCTMDQTYHTKSKTC